MGSFMLRPRTSLSSLILSQVMQKQTPLISSPKINTLLSSSSETPFCISNSHMGWCFSFATRAESIEELLAQVEREKHREREEKKKAGLEIDEGEDDVDYMGVGPLIEKLEKEKLKDWGDLLYQREEPTDSESEDDERFLPEAIKKRNDQFQKKIKRHEELLKNFVDSDTFDDAYKWMDRINKFEEKHFKLPLEYRVIGELMNRLKVATGKDQFLLQQKLNRAMRLVERKEAFDPNNPSNYGPFEHQEMGQDEDVAESTEVEEERRMIQGVGINEDEDEDDDIFDEMQNRDDILLEKLNSIDKMLEEKLAELDHTFGKKGKVLEEEIRDLADERNSLTEKRGKPLRRLNFDAQVIDVNQTVKVTKGGQVRKFTGIVACGNYQGLIGFARAKGPTVPGALDKAYEKCFENLHYVELHEDHTITQATQASYKKTKVYLWPAPTRVGVVAGRIVKAILYLAGFKNIRSKVIGSRNPYNTCKAVFKALNAVETPKDIQQKFGRAVVESRLL